MRCPKCNYELDEHGICPNCYHIEDIQTMSKRETNTFDGITIEDTNNYRKESSAQEQSSQSEYSYQNNNNTRYYRTPRSNGIKVRYVNLSGKSSSWLTRAFIALGGLAVVAFFFFVALPVLLTLVGAGLVAWIIFRFFRR